MPIDNRGYYGGDHSAACFCNLCESRRRLDVVEKGPCSRCNQNRWAYLRPQSVWQCQTDWCGNIWGSPEKEATQSGHNDTTRQLLEDLNSELPASESPVSKSEPKVSLAPGSTPEDIRNIERSHRDGRHGRRWILGLAIVTCLVIVFGAFAWNLSWTDSLLDLFPIADEEQATPTPTLVLAPTITPAPPSTFSATRTPTPIPISTFTPPPVPTSTHVPILIPSVTPTMAPTPIAATDLEGYISLCVNLIREKVSEKLWPNYDLQADSWCRASYVVRSYEAAAEGFLRVIGR